MAADDFDISYVADLARLELSEGEKTLFGPQLLRVVDYLAKLEELNLTDVEPMSHAVDTRNIMREDEVNHVFSREDALLNAPRKSEDEFLVPPVLG